MLLLQEIPFHLGVPEQPSTSNKSRKPAHGSC